MATEVRGNNDFESCFSSPTPSKIRKIKRKTWSQSTDPEPELDYLKEGLKVEVLSQEDGFEDALLPAIVLKPPLSLASPPSKKRVQSKALVQFESLLSDDESKLLKERVKISFIRPTPPPDSDDCVLEPNHVVDAFFQDVWWTGVITKVLDGRYWVAFKHPPDLIGFSRSQLRPHWDWGNGFWVKASKQKTDGLRFCPDDEVELSLEYGEPCTKWFPAVFLGEVGMDSFMVQYRSSVNNEKEYLHKVIVKLQQLRPFPPRFKDKVFELMEKVDAFYEGCWYVGFVTRVLLKKRYTVTGIHEIFKKDFNHSEMRPHLEWRGEQWITNSMITGDSLDLHTTSCANTWHNEVEQLTPTVHKLAIVNVKSSRVKKVVAGILSDNTSEKNVLVETNVIELRDMFAVDIQPCIIFPKSFQVNKTFRAAYKDIEQQEVGQPENQETISAKKFGMLSKSQNERFKRTCRHLEAFQYSATVQEGSAHKICDKKVVEAEHVMEIDESSGMSGLQFEELMGLNGENSSELPSKVKQQEDATVPSVIEGNGEQTQFLVANSEVVASADVTMDTIELPEPSGVELPATLGSLPNNPTKHPGDEDRRTVEVMTNCTTDKSEVPGTTGMEIIGTSDSLRDNVIWHPGEGSHGARSAKADATINILHLSTTTRMQQTVTSGSVSDSVPLHLGEEKNGTRSVAADITIDKFGFPESTGTQSIDHCLTMKTKKAAADLPSYVSADERPVSPCMREAHSETNVNHSGDCEQEDPRSDLPFSKNCSIWQRIESMEVFIKLPQKPHFRPLVKYSELYREGSAIGKMITFASLVEKTSNLQADEPMEFFKISFDALAELEELGFDVKVVRDRLNELLSIRTKLERLKNDSKQVHTKIVEYKEKNQFEKEVAEIDNDIKKLEERRAILTSNNVAKGFEVNRLEEEAASINKSIQSVQQNFTSVAVAPW